MCTRVCAFVLETCSFEFDYNRKLRNTLQLRLLFALLPAVSHRKNTHQSGDIRREEIKQVSVYCVAEGAGSPSTFVFFFKSQALLEGACGP